jgi:hypothetical protein
MSIAPLSARLFRFLAVVASAPFIILLLGTGSHADQPTPADLTPAFSSRPLRNNLMPRPPILHYVQYDDATCVSCVWAKQKECQSNLQSNMNLLGQQYGQQYTAQGQNWNCVAQATDWCYQNSYCPRNYQANPFTRPPPP